MMTSAFSISKNIVIPYNSDIIWVIDEYITEFVIFVLVVYSIGNSCVLHDFPVLEWWRVSYTYSLRAPGLISSLLGGVTVLLILLAFHVVFCLINYSIIIFSIFVLCLVCPMSPVSLDCPFFIVSSVFSNVYIVLLYMYIIYMLIHKLWFITI
jgi:hypothetical protein